VVVMVGSGASGQVVSHGSESGPKRYSLTAAKTYFPRPVRALRCPGVGALAEMDSDPDLELGDPGLEEGFVVDPDGSNPALGDPGDDA
jgi:hypothetical protein